MTSTTLMRNTFCGSASASPAGITLAEDPGTVPQTRVMSRHQSSMRLSSMRKAVSAAFSPVSQFMDSPETTAASPTHAAQKMLFPMEDVSACKASVQQPVELTESAPPSPVKLLVSDEPTACIVRLPFTMLVKCVAMAVAAQCAVARMVPLLRSLFPRLPVWKMSRRAIVASVTVGCTATVAFASIRAAHQKWSHYMQPVAMPCKDFFHVRRPGQPEPENVAGVLFDMAEKKWQVWPRPSIEAVMQRALCFTGMSFRTALHLDHTVGIEYPLVSLVRLVRYYFGMDRKTPTRESLYNTVVNTSLACFIDYDETSETHGHVVLRSTLLPLHTDATREFSEIVVEVDHENCLVVGMWCTYRDAASLPMVKEVYGRVNAAENSHPMLSEAAQVNQMAQFICTLVSNATHTMVHWFSNGTGMVEDKVWATASMSTAITNWMNTSACVKTSSFFGDNVPHWTHILTHNVANGLPMHGSAKTGLSSLQATVSERSKMHGMASAARKAITPHIEKLENIDDECRTRHMRLIEAIVTATVLHSADHYYLWDGAGHMGETLLATQTDMGGILQCLVRPIAYRSVGLLVKDRFDEDPMNKLIYDACFQIDPEFADTALSVGCAY